MSEFFTDATLAVSLLPLFAGFVIAVATMAYIFRLLRVATTVSYLHDALHLYFEEVHEVDIRPDTFQRGEFAWLFNYDQLPVETNPLRLGQFLKRRVHIKGNQITVEDRNGGIKHWAEQPSAVPFPVEPVRG